MLKRIRISVTAPVLLPNNLLHSATIYKISKTITFQETDIIVNETSTTKLYDNNFTVDIKNDDTLYISTQYVYTVIDENGELVYNEDGSIKYQYGTPSRISSLKGDQSGVKISDTIVGTPTVKINTSYEINFEGNLKITTSDFKMYSSIGKHLSTTWLVKDIEGNVIFKREKDVDNLTSIIITEDIKLSDNFIVYVSHHSDTNADSNYGIIENIITNELPYFSIKPLSKLIVGKYLYFNVDILNKRYKNIDLFIYDYNTNKFISNVIGINNSLIKINTNNFTLNTLYKFVFKITSENDITREYEINLYSNDYKIKYDLNKKYLDKYDYNSLFFTNGETSTLSYQLSNDSILLMKNITNYIIESRLIENKLTYLNSKTDLESDPIINPNLYVNELLNGDVLISYKLSREGKSEIYIDVYSLNPENNELLLINSNKLDSTISLTSSGAITVSYNKVYYIDYISNTMTILDPYTGTYESITLPYNAISGYSLVTDFDNNIILLGGTNDDLGNYTINHQRVNDKVYKFNINNKVFTEIGLNLLKDLPRDLYQFHLVYRHDNKITMFNNINNNNYDMIADQSTYILDLINETLTFTYNDHEDGLPYNNTIVLRNGDVLRYTNLLQDPQKLYTYVSDSMTIDSIDDNNTLIYNPNTLTIKTGEILNIPKPCKYDSITLEDGAYVTLGDDLSTTYSNKTLILTRDTVMTTTEFEAKGYTDIFNACQNTKLVIVG